MRTLANTTAITCVTIAALQLVDGEWFAAAALAAAGVAAYLATHLFPLSGCEH